MKKQLLFIFFVSLFIQAKAQFADMECWELVELVQFDSDLFQFKNIDSSVKQVKLIDVKTGDQMIWKYQRGVLVAYSQNSAYDRDKKVKVFNSNGLVDSIVQKIDNYWMELQYYSYDSLGSLIKIAGNSMSKKWYKKQLFSRDNYYEIATKIDDEFLIVYDTVTQPRMIDSIPADEVLNSYYNRTSQIKDSLSFDKKTRYRKHFGCVYTESDYMLMHLQKPVRTCPDSLLLTEVSHFEQLGNIKTIDVIYPKSSKRNYTVYFEYTKSGLLERIYLKNGKKEEDLYVFKYKLDRKKTRKK